MMQLPVRDVEGERDRGREGGKEREGEIDGERREREGEHMSLN